MGAREDAYDGWVRQVFRTNPWTLGERGRSGWCSSLARLYRNSARTRLRPRQKGGAQRDAKSRIAQRGVSRPPTEEQNQLERAGIMRDA